MENININDNKNKKLICCKIRKNKNNQKNENDENIKLLNKQICDEIIKEKKEINEKIGVDMDDITKSIDEILVGMEKRERLLSEKEKTIVAHHEAGHALVAYLLKNTLPPIKVSIIPRGEAALGYSQQEYIDKKLYSKEELFDKICVCLGGRIGEIVKFGNYTTGASDDIEKMTEIAYNMVSIYGMSKLGCIKYDLMGEKTNGQMHSMSDKTKESIDIRVKDIIDNAFNITKNILETHKDKLEILAKHLLDNEELLSSDIEKLVGKELKSTL